MASGYAQLLGAAGAHPEHPLAGLAICSGAFGRRCYTPVSHSSRGFRCLVGWSHSSPQARRPSRMPNANSRLGSGQRRLLRQRWSRAPGLLTDALLPRATVQAALQAEAVTFRDRVFTPLVTLYTFLGQVLDADHSC